MQCILTTDLKSKDGKLNWKYLWRQIQPTLCHVILLGIRFDTQSFTEPLICHPVSSIRWKDGHKRHRHTPVETKQSLIPRNRLEALEDAAVGHRRFGLYTLHSSLHDVHRVHQEKLDNSRYGTSDGMHFQIRASWQWCRHHFVFGTVWQMKPIGTQSIKNRQWQIVFSSLFQIVENLLFMLPIHILDAGSFVWFMLKKSTKKYLNTQW